MDLYDCACLKNLDILIDAFSNLLIVSSINHCGCEMSVITSANKLIKPMNGMTMINPATT